MCMQEICDGFHMGIPSLLFNMNGIVLLRDEVIPMATKPQIFR